MADVPFSGLVGRAGTGADLPKQVIDELLDEVRSNSTVLDLARVVQTDSKDSRIGILTQDIDAFFVDGDAGLKGTSTPTWRSQSVIAEEIAVVVPIDDNSLADSSVDLWSQIKPLIARAFARKIDDAVLFGIDAPTSWGTSLVGLATAGNATVTASDDPVVDILAAAALVSGKQLTPTAAAVAPGWQWKAAATRSTALTGSPVGRDAGRPFATSIAGFPVVTDPTSWRPASAEAIVCAWDQVVVGMRSDLRFDMFNSGILQNPDGSIALNLIQNDSQALRATMRLGVAVRQPVIGRNSPALPVAIVEPVASVEPPA